MASSPNALKARLTEALERVQILEREKKNAKAREKRAKTTVRSLLAHLSERTSLMKSSKTDLSSTQVK